MIVKRVKHSWMIILERDEEKPCVTGTDLFTHQCLRLLIQKEYIFVMSRRDSIPQQTYPMSPSPSSAQDLLDNGQGVIDPEVYFQMNKPPANLAEFEEKLSAFVDYHYQQGNRVVLITASIFSLSILVFVLLLLLSLSLF